MTELTKGQVTRLALVIESWILSDPDLLWDVAVEQAQGWTLREYHGQFPDEGGATQLSHEQVARLAEHIAQQMMLSDDSLLWGAAAGQAVEQAQGWTLGEYRDLFKEEA